MTTATDATPSQVELSASRDQVIRDATKWLMASAAAVGAALIAGSQLSSIGKLELAWPTDVDSARLWIAVVGAAVGIGAVAAAILLSAGLLVEQGVNYNELVDAWDKPKHKAAPAAKFFQDNPKYLQGSNTPMELEADRSKAVAELQDEKTTDDRAIELEREIADLDDRAFTILLIARSKMLEHGFHALARSIVWCGAVTAVGITLFAWAANPPTVKEPSVTLTQVSLVGADLRDADLSNADLTGANLTNADLTGATLKRALLTDVTWSNTICPDGTNSDRAKNSCAGHT